MAILSHEESIWYASLQQCSSDSYARDRGCRSLRSINMSPKFELHIVISQSTRTGEAHHCFDRQFYPTFKGAKLIVHK